MAPFVASAMITFAQSLPRVDEAGPAIDARVRNVYVVPGFRRRGIARELVGVSIAEAAREGAVRLTLGTSPDGKPLYESLGFARKDDEMIFAGPLRADVTV